MPIVFVEGIGGQLFRDLGMTVSFSLLASLAVSLTLMPTLYALFSRKKKEAPAKQEPALPDVGAYRGTFYSKLLTFALRFRYLILVAAVLLILQAGQLWRGLGVNLVPEMSQGDYFVLLELHEGTPIEKTDRMAAWIEEQLLAVDGVGHVFSNIGELNQGTESRSGENLAQINYDIAENAAAAAVNAAIRTRLEAGPEFDYRIGSPSYFSFKTPVEIEVFLEDRDRLEAVSAALVSALGKLPMLEDIRTTVADGNPEVQITFNREAMSRMGLFNW